MTRTLKDATWQHRCPDLDGDTDYPPANALRPSQNTSTRPSEWRIWRKAFLIAFTIVGVVMGCWMIYLNHHTP